MGTGVGSGERGYARDLIPQLFIWGDINIYVYMYIYMGIYVYLPLEKPNT